MSYLNKEKLKQNNRSTNDRGVVKSFHGGNGFRAGDKDHRGYDKFKWGRQRLTARLIATPTVYRQVSGLESIASGRNLAGEISEKFPRIFRHSAMCDCEQWRLSHIPHLPGFAAGYFFSTQWQMRFRSIGSNLFLRNHGICPSAGITRCPLVAAHVVA